MRHFIIFAVLMVTVAFAVPARNFRGSNLLGKADNRQQPQPQPAEGQTEESESGDSSSTDKANECGTTQQQAGESSDAEKSAEGQNESDTEEPKGMGGAMNSPSGKRNARKF